MVLVMKGTNESPTKSLIVVLMNVNMATRVHFPQVSNSTPMKYVCSEGPSDMNCVLNNLRCENVYSTTDNQTMSNAAESLLSSNNVWIRLHIQS